MQTLNQRKDTNGRTGMIVKRVSVPIGLEELMEGLSKEVILRKPKDMYLFASEYFAKLVNLRGKSNKYKAHPVHTIQSVAKLKHMDVPPLKKISPARPVKHLSRQLSIRSKSPKLHRPIQTEPITKRDVTSKSRERKTSTDRKDSIARGISKTLPSKDVSKSLNTKGVTSTGPSSVQSTPRDKRRPSVVRKVKSSTNDDQNKAREENKKTSRQPKRTKSEKVQAALISPIVIEETVTDSAGTVESESTKISSISSPTKIHDLQQSENEQIKKHITSNTDRDDKPNVLISKSSDKSLDSDILAQSTNIAEISKNIHLNEKDSESSENKNMDISSSVINDKKGDALHIISSDTENKELEKKTEVDERDNIVDKEDNNVNAGHDTKNVQSETSIVKEVTDKLDITIPNSEVTDNKTDSEGMLTSVEDLPDDIFSKDLPKADDNQDIEIMSQDAMDLVQNIKSEKSDADSTNNSKLPVKNTDKFVGDINVELEDKKLHNEKVDTSNSTIREKDLLIAENIDGTGENKGISDSVNKISEPNISDTIYTNLHNVNSFVSEQKLAVEEIGTDKNDTGKKISQENTILNTSKVNKTETKILQNKYANEGSKSNEVEEDNIVHKEIEEQSYDKLVEKAINETEPISLVNKDITDNGKSEKLPTLVTSTLVSGVPENTPTETSESQCSVTKDILQKIETNVETLGEQQSKLLPNEEKKDSKNKVVDVEEVISKSVQSGPNNENDNAVSNNEQSQFLNITDSSKLKDINDKVTIKMENLDQSDSLLTVSIPHHIENIDKNKLEKSSELDDDNKNSESMEKIDATNSTDDIPQERNQFFRKNEELVSKKDDKTKISINDSDGETIEDLHDQKKDIPSDISGKIDMPYDNVSNDFKKDSADKLEVEKLVNVKSQEETSTKNKSLSAEVDNDKKVLEEPHDMNLNDVSQDAHSNITQHIINYELSKNHPGVIDSPVKHFLNSFINNEQLNVFKSKEEQEDNKTRMKESQEHSKKENELLNENKEVPLKSDEVSKDTLPVGDVKEYAASPLTFSSVKDLLDFDPSNTLNTSNQIQSVKEQESVTKEEVHLEISKIVPDIPVQTDSTDDIEKIHIQEKADEQLSRANLETQNKISKKDKNQIGVDFQEIESFNNISKESTSEIKATEGPINLGKNGISVHVNNESVNLKPLTETLIKSEILSSSSPPITEGENISSVLQNPNIQRELPGNVSETALISKSDPSTTSKEENSPEIDNNVLNSKNLENYIKTAESSANHINKEEENTNKLEIDQIKQEITPEENSQNMKNLVVDTEDNLLKSDKMEVSEKAANLKMTELKEIFSSVDVIQNIMKSKISLQNPGVLDSSVSQYLHSFLNNEQTNVFQNISSEQNKSASLIKNQKSKEDSTLNNTRVLNNSIPSKLTNRPFLSKKERSQSQENILNTERKLPDTSTKNNKMRRVRSVGIIKPIENEHKSKIPASARKSAGRKPLVRQLETDSKDIEEKLINRKELSKSTQGISPRGSKESKKRASLESKDMTDKAENHLKEADAKKTEDMPNDDTIKSQPEKDINKLILNDIVTKEDVLIAKTILKGIEGAEKHIQLIEEKSSSNVKNTDTETDNKDIKDTEDSANRNDVSANIRRKSNGSKDIKKDQVATGKETHKNHPENLANLDRSETPMESKVNLIDKTDMAGETIESSTDIKNMSSNIETKGDANSVKNESFLDTCQIKPTSKEIQESQEEKSQEIPKYSKESPLDSLIDETNKISENVETVPKRDDILDNNNSKNHIGIITDLKENGSSLDRFNPVSAKLLKLENVTKSDKLEIPIDSEKPSSNNLIDKTHGTETVENLRDTDDISMNARIDVHTMQGQKENILVVDRVESVAKDIHEIQSKNILKNDGIPKDPEKPLVENILDKAVVVDKPVGAAGKDNISEALKDKSDVDNVNDQHKDISDVNRVESNDIHDIQSKNDGSEVLGVSEKPLLDNLLEKGHVLDKIVESVAGRDDTSNNSVIDQKEDLDRAKTIIKVDEIHSKKLSNTDGSKVFIGSGRSSPDNFLERTLVAGQTVKSVADGSAIVGHSKSESDIKSVNDISSVDRIEYASKEIGDFDSKKNSDEPLPDNPTERYVKDETEEKNINDKGVILGDTNSKSDGVIGEKDSILDPHPTEFVSNETHESEAESSKRRDVFETFTNSQEGLLNNHIKETSKTNEISGNILERELVDIKKTSDIDMNNKNEHIVDVDSVPKKSDQHPPDNLAQYEPNVPSDPEKVLLDNLIKETNYVAKPVNSATAKGNLSGDIKDELGEVKENILKDDRVESKSEKTLPTNLSNFDSSKKLNDLEQSSLEGLIEKTKLPSGTVESDAIKEIPNNKLIVQSLPSSNKQIDDTEDSKHLISVSEEIVTGDSKITNSENDILTTSDETKDPEMVQDLKKKDNSAKDIIPTVAYNKSDAAAMTIQKTWKGFHVRKDLKNKTKNDASKDIERSEDISTDKKLKEQLNAAVKIQSRWRGYVIRKMMDNSGKMNGQVKHKQEEAIIKIQAIVRGYLDRLKYQKLKARHADLSNEVKKPSTTDLHLDKISSGQETEDIEKGNLKSPIKTKNIETKSKRSINKKESLKDPDNTDETASDEKQKRNIKTRDEHVETRNGEIIGQEGIKEKKEDNYEFNEPQKNVNDNFSADKNLEEDIKRTNHGKILTNTLIGSGHVVDFKDQEEREDQSFKGNSPDEHIIYKEKNNYEGFKKNLEDHNKSLKVQSLNNEETDSKVNDLNTPNVEEKPTDKELIENKNTGNKKNTNGNNDIKNSTVTEIDLSKSTIQEKYPYQVNISEDHVKNYTLCNESMENLTDNKNKTDDTFNKQIEQHSSEDKTDNDILKPNLGDKMENIEDLMGGDNNPSSNVNFKSKKEGINDNKIEAIDNNKQIKESVEGANESKIILNEKLKETPEKRENDERPNLLNQVETNGGLDMKKDEYKEEKVTENTHPNESSINDTNKSDEKGNADQIIPVNSSSENNSSKETTNEKRTDPKQENNFQEAEKLQEDIVFDKNIDNDSQKNSKNDTVIRKESGTIKSDKNPSTVQGIKSVIDLNIEDNIAPSEVPVNQSSIKEKPDFYRSNTVVEPIIVKKAISHLGDTSKNNSIETQPVNGNIDPNEKDDNNNTQNKEETELESEVRSTINQIINGQNQSKSSLEVEIKAAVKNIMENNVDSSKNLENEKDKNNDEETINVHAILDKLPPVPSHEISDHTISEDIHVNEHTTENNAEFGANDTLISETGVKLDQTTESLSQADQGDISNEDVRSEISKEKKNQVVDRPITSENDPVLPVVSESVNDEKELKNNKEPLSSEINADDVSSVDSIDSVITVVPNVNYDSSNKKENVSSDQNVLQSRSLSADAMKEKENKEVLSKNFVKKSLSTDALKGHVDLIDHVQNTLLDQISGKPVDTANKFDIEQLRKELHEATSLYKSEEEDPHFPGHDDELLEYLNDFEPEDENSYDSKIIRTPNRELPDIEEEVDCSNDDIETTRKATSDQGKSGFCKTPSNIPCSAEKLIDNKPLKDHVEIVNLEKLKHGHNEIIINNDKIRINRTEGTDITTTEESDQKLLHTSELHDMVIPMGMGSSATNRRDLNGSGKLKHTSEFHDTLVVPLPSGSDVNIKNEAKEMLENNNPSEPPKTETVNSGNQTATQQSPAGAPVVTSRRSSQDGVAVAEAQASLRDTSPAKPKSVESFTHQSPSPCFVKQAMESEHNNNKRNNAISNRNSAPGKNMEAEAATKIQAGFRGYQVRKQLKTKNATDKSNERHSLRRKSSGRKNANTDLAEKSAVKIQAGVRGFLVRRRQKKQLSSSASA